MVDWLAATFNVLALLPILALAAAVVFVGYFAYETRLERERIARLPPRVDPMESFPRLVHDTRQQLVEAQATLERTRTTVLKGTR